MAMRNSKRDGTNGKAQGVHGSRSEKRAGGATGARGKGTSRGTPVRARATGDSSRPIGIDLFAGAGGLSLGFEQAGFDVKAAVEIDPVHCAIHEYNFPRTAVIPKSVVGLSAAEIRMAAGIGSAPVDCVFGGPPCQGFSLIGHRVLDDPRNGLVLEFVRIVAELDAKTFVFENVKGLTIGKHRRFLEELVEAFDAAGYSVRMPWRVLDAACYGTPQHRQRLILMGAKKGLPLPDYPETVTEPVDAKKKDPKAKRGPNVEDALGDLPDADRYATLDRSDSVRVKTFGKPSAYAAELRCMQPKAWHCGYIRKWDSGMLTSSARTTHTEISRMRFSETPQGEVEPISRFFRLAGSGLSNTLRAGTDGARGAFTSPRPIHYKYDRCITVREMARLHGFPDWFRLHATKWHGARQIGNAVPPPLARAVASQLIKVLDAKPERPKKKVALGDPALLYMEQSEAADRFGVTPQPQRRDRKSGAKKRKQVEIEIARGRLRVIQGGR